MVQYGRAAEVFAQPATAWVAEFLGQQNVFARGDMAIIVPESAVVLGEGESHTVISRQITEQGETLKVAHEVGELTLHLSAREASRLDGNALRLRLIEAKVREVADDRGGG